MVKCNEENNTIYREMKLKLLRVGQGRIYEEVTFELND